MKIRTASNTDFDAIVRIEERVGKQNSYRSEQVEYAIKNGFCIVATIDFEVLGYLLWNPKSFRSSDFVDLVVVDPTFRRIGVATALLADVLNRSTTSTCWTSTNASNTAMRALLSKLGWIDSGYQKELDAGDPDLFYFATKLESKL